jgi:5-(carboxyamino)imidazole ribonucleotide synthase
VLATTQDRLIEKTFLVKRGIPTAGFMPVVSREDLDVAVEKLGCPTVLKTRRFGYDGKGQAAIRSPRDSKRAWAAVGGQPSILETFVNFEREISVVAARGREGGIACFDVTHNEHHDHILKTSKVPAGVTDEIASEAVSIAERIATAFNYIGILAVEMFVLPRETDGPRILVNEIAPRVHNSGHWTLDGASVSQFEQHIRAIAGWPLASPITRGRVEMTNLIGSEAQDYARWLGVPGASLHLYGKSAIREGRKMGHVTRVF